jgi:hypothetical protein
MKLKFILFGVLLLAMLPSRASGNGIIVRLNVGTSPQILADICLLQNCTVAPLDGTIGQLFLLTLPDGINLTPVLNLLSTTLGIVDAEVDQVIDLTEGLATVGTIPEQLTDSTPLPYWGSIVWQGYALQPATGLVQLPTAQNTYQYYGSGIVADIDTGVDPSHPALVPVLLQGYDFTRNQPGGSEMTDFTGTPPSGTATAPVQVNQHTVAMVDSPTGTLLLGDSQYSAFGHGTMVMGIIHLVAPQAQLLPLKAFSSNGTANLSDILRAVYYAVENNANVINMSFDLSPNSVEFATALAYATSNNIICVASAGNDGVEEIVYPAAYVTNVMGVASVNDLGARSSFSNYGDSIVWVAAPGEGIISTYPFGTYSAGWGTSFSAPFVSGTVALLLNSLPTINQIGAAAAIGEAQFISSDMGQGLLQIPSALQSLAGTALSPKVSLSVPKVTFANQAVGTNSGLQSVTLSNPGTAALNISSVSLTGQNVGSFSASNSCGSLLALNANCSITVQFNPTVMGLASASVTIVDNAPGSPHSLSLIGLGLAPAIALSAPSITFPGQLVTTSSAAQALSITDSGNVLLSLTGASISGTNAGDFSLLNNCGSSLAVSAVCSLSVTFRPSGTGTRTASLVIGDNVPGSLQQTIQLTGPGTDFALGTSSGGSNAATVTAGQTASFPLSVSPVSGFSGPVALSCTGAPAKSTCSLSQSGVTLAGASGSNVTVSVATTASSSSMGFPSPFAAPRFPLVSAPLCATYLVSFATLLALWTNRKRFARPAMRIAWLLPLAVLLVGLSGCGTTSSSNNGGGNGGNGGGTSAGTPVGTYTITVTGTSNGVSHSQSFTMTVN